MTTNELPFVITEDGRQWPITTKCTLWLAADGSIWTYKPNPQPEGDPFLEGESEQQYLDRHAIHFLSDRQEENLIRRTMKPPLPLIPMPVRLASVDMSVVDAMDYLFRACWAWDGKTLVVDVAKARQQRQRELLAARDAVLREGKIASLAVFDDAAKVKLRLLLDMEKTLPAKLAACVDVESLKALVPEELKA